MPLINLTNNTISTQKAVSSNKVDCHVHLFDPARFPYQKSTQYSPQGHELATREQLFQLLENYQVNYALLVAPNSAYATDNTCMLDAIAHYPHRLKGIAVVENDISENELLTLKKAGVVGIAFNATFYGTEYYAHTHSLLALLHQLNMCVQVQVEGEQLDDLLPLLLSSPVTVVIDHCGRPVPTKGVAQPGMKALKQLADTKRAFIKLSGYAKFSSEFPPYQDVHKYIRAIIDTFTPEHCMWASDWPFLRANHRIDYGVMLSIVDQVLTDPHEKNQILYSTANSLFGFSHEEFY